MSLLYCKLLFWVERELFTDMLSDVSQNSVLSKCSLEVLVLISRFVEKESPTIYSQFLRRIVLRSSRVEHNQHYNVLRKNHQSPLSASSFPNSPESMPLKTKSLRLSGISNSSSRFSNSTRRSSFSTRNPSSSATVSICLFLYSTTSNTLPSTRCSSPRPESASSPFTGSTLFT